MPAEARSGPIVMNGHEPPWSTHASPAAGHLEAAQVRAMFDRIAGVYDLMNTVMTAGLHRRWRERAADLAHVGAGARVLDVATGTGDLALELVRRVGVDGEVVGSDFSESMLTRARQKATGICGGGAHLRFEIGDALALPYAEDSFDAATVGFGARNFADLPRGLCEMARVVRPGGRVVVLEITSPTRAPLSHFYGLWFDRIVPLLGRLAGAVSAGLRRAGRAARGAGIADAYTYLPSSVRRFPGPAELAGEMQRAGLVDVRCVLTAGGIVAIHVGTVAPAT
jgi:demethylmenaquinone methyltransferase / 2-methoxy-6-polyprenyl-1,4-benzoquinol methylase